MDLKKLHVHITKRGEEKYELTALSVDKVIWFSLPDQLKELNLHKELLAVKTIVSSKNSITKVGGYRKIAIGFKPELKKQYLDGEENFCINDHYLEEYELDSAAAICRDLGEIKTSNEIFLINRIKELENRISITNEINLSEVEQKFLLSKFNGKQEASAWITSFEKECIRFKILDGSTRIEALKLFVDGNVKDWYSSNLIKLPLTDWEPWKNSFLLVYGKKNWTVIRKAFNYKYVFGSMIDFVLKKERLLLEADKDMSEMYRIYQIVYNLPLEIQDKIDREKIETIADLISKLKRFNDSYTVNKKINEKKCDENKKNTETDKKTIVKSSKIDRKPCNICEGLGYKNRYHPADVCRYKASTSKNIVNLTEQDEDSDSDSTGNELLEIEMDDNNQNQKN